MSAPAAVPPAQPALTSATSLYCGDLDQSITEAQLYDLFSTIGPVVSIRVCRDLITRRSLGYAYVNFQQGPDAARAIDVLNFQVVNDKPIRIMYSQRDPALRRSGVGNIFIKNLDKDIDNKALYDTFAQFGNIVSAKVASDMQGQSKGYGFVQFDTAEAAQTAIDKVNGMLMNDKQVYVGPFQRRGERGGGPSTFNNVYVKNLHESVLEDKLREVFEKYGTLTSVVVMKDAEGKSKGFGFVCFEDTEAASKAVEELDGYSAIEDKAWIVCRAQKKAEREAELKAKFDAERRERMEKMAGANLYIKNLEDTVDDAKLRELFQEFGTITSCRVMRDTSGARCDTNEIPPLLFFRMYSYLHGCSATFAAAQCPVAPSRGRRRGCFPTLQSTSREKKKKEKKKYWKKRKTRTGVTKTSFAFFLGKHFRVNPDAGMPQMAERLDADLSPPPPPPRLSLSLSYYSISLVSTAVAPRSSPSLPRTRLLEP